jgi:hypothetical protein
VIAIARMRSIILFLLSRIDFIDNESSSSDEAEDEAAEAQEEEVKTNDSDGINIIITIILERGLS